MNDDEENDVFVSAGEKLQTDCSIGDFLCIEDEVVTIEPMSVEEMIEYLMQEGGIKENNDENNY